MNENLLAIVFLALIAGGPIVVIDALIIRRIRRLGSAGSSPSPDDRTTRQ